MLDQPATQPRWVTATAYALCALPVVGGVGAIALVAARGDAVTWAQFDKVVGRWTLPLWAWLGDAVVGLAVLALLTRRRRAPVPVALLAVLASTVSWCALLPAAWATASAASRLKLRDALGLGAGVVAVRVLVRLALGGAVASGWTLVVADAVATALLVLFGQYLGTRRALVESAQQRALDAEASVLAAAEQARGRERSRIAREMHDVVAHQISLVALYCGAIRTRPDLGADEVRALVATIESTAEHAMTELRGVLTTLREGAPEAWTPQPSLAEVPPLVAEARAAGQQVDLTGPPDLTGLSPRAGRDAYRVVQECLTNARKHAPGRPVEVRLSGDAEEGLLIETANPLDAGARPGAGSRLGLVGLAERIHLAGGTVEWEAQADRFVLTAWLPWT